MRSTLSVLLSSGLFKPHSLKQVHLYRQWHKCTFWQEMSSYTMNDKGILCSLHEDVEIPDNISMPKFVLQNCKKHSSLTALVDALTGKTYNYSELNSMVKNVAQGLKRAGFKRGDTLAICSTNCAEYVIPLLAAPAIGGVVTTVNPAYKPEEIMKQLIDSNAKYIITAKGAHNHVAEVAEEIPGLKGSIYCFDDTQECRPFQTLMADSEADVELDEAIDPVNDVAILPYSSGTTGLPKGVMLTHHNLIANVCQITSPNMWNFRSENRYLGLLPMFHIFGAFVQLCTVYSGASMYMLPQFQPETFLETIQKYRITHAHVVPPLVQFLLKHPLVDKYDLSSLKAVYSGAAPLGSQVSEMLHNRIQTLDSIQQGYGLTELSPGAMVVPDEKTMHGSVGHLVPNTEAKVINLETGEPLGPNTEGEILIRGPQVMKGYLNNKAETDRVIDNDKFFHTGDTGYYTEDGTFFVVDRVKELIKFKGFQVAPAELEAHILSHSHVADVAVVGVPDEVAGELPKAFVVKKANMALTETQVEKHVEDKMAPYKKLRGGVEFVEEIPKSASGKILRRVLRKQEESPKKAKQL